jgi:hypothetical protein
MVWRPKEFPRSDFYSSIAEISVLGLGFLTGDI